jgi:hypothetical protein
LTRENLSESTSNQKLIIFENCAKSIDSMKSDRSIPAKASVYASQRARLQAEADLLNRGNISGRLQDILDEYWIWKDSEAESSPKTKAPKRQSTAHRAKKAA